jgi:hypothetical protein
LAGIQEKSYEIFLSPEDRERYRHVKQGKRILAFTVQYETLAGGEWRPVIRYDTAHGTVHKDILDLRGREKKVWLGLSDLREALLLADQDIRTNWQQYKERFLRRKR